MKDFIYNPAAVSKMSLRRITLRWSHFEAGLFAIMVGCSENFAMYYSVKRGIHDTQLAVLSLFPILLGALCNWIVPRFVKQAYLKQFLLISIGIQVFGLLGLYYSTLVEDHFFPWILVSMSLYWIGGMTSGPFWIDWMTPWLPARKISRYLFRRNGFVALCIVVSYLLAASFIYRDTSLVAYEYIFGLAVLARLCSWLILYGQASPSRSAQMPAHTSPMELKAAFAYRPILIILIFSIAFRFGSNVASPFFLPYMVNELHFNLITYAWITAVPFLARAILMSQWGEAVHNFRPFVGVQIAMAMLTFVCFAWTLTSSIPNLTAIEAMSGIAWGGFDLSILIILNAHAPARARGIVGFHQAGSYLAALIGALYGSFLLRKGWTSTQVFEHSSLLRLLLFASFVYACMNLKDHRSSIKSYGMFLLTALSVRNPLLNILPDLRPNRKKPKNPPAT